MGQFTNTAEFPSTKKLQRVTVPIELNDVNDIEDLERCITAAPDSWEAEVNAISGSSGKVSGSVTLTAKGATVTDITRRLQRAGISFAAGRPKTEKLED